jgi:hypothetical protein
MSIINKIPRALRVLLVMVVLAVLVWQFAFDTAYFYYALGAAVLLTALTIFAVFRRARASGVAAAEMPRQKQAKTKNEEEEGGTEAADERVENEVEDTASLEPLDSARDVSGEPAEASDSIAVEADYTDIPPSLRDKMPGDFRSNSAKADAADVAARYRQMARTISSGEEAYIRPSVKAAATSQQSARPVEAEKSQPGSELLETESPAAAAAETGEPPIPLIEDESVLTPEETNELVNAVWYRCENPYCKYTSFLTVHHIIEEKDGGSNALINLIVLCPYCHSLAHRKEIPEEEMREWINREDRFRFKPEWQYYEIKKDDQDES